MSKQGLQRLHEQRISIVLHYMLNNLGGDLSLDKLASLSNYSPFHFQRIFREVTGETPKQHAVRLRLENAAHYLVIHREKSVTEIALDSGFASGSTFARAFRQHFGVSAEYMRHMSLEEKTALYRENDRVRTFLPRTGCETAVQSKPLKVVVKHALSIRTIFERAALTDDSVITEGFKKIIGFAETRDLLSSRTRLIGVINPHQQIYNASVSLDVGDGYLKGALETVISAGKFATFVLTGSTQDTLNSLRTFYEQWLPGSGYRIANSNGYEVLRQNPLLLPYESIEREIYIAIEPL
jgi:AraC family transcriptional regulator